MSPASGDHKNFVKVGKKFRVSIQLMSPASGDSLIHQYHYYLLMNCFHSINVPSEWGLPETHPDYAQLTNVSIQLMSPASGDKVGSKYRYVDLKNGGFHSINVPSEWGLHNQQRKKMRNAIFVSIQLMSPASGDTIYYALVF